MKDGWQPIETAPKEWLGFGKPHRILVWSPVMKRIMLAFWQYGYWKEEGDDYDTKATHWHPLPQIPDGVEEL